MKKKRVLFVVGSLGGGGAEKFIITLLQGLDQQKYDVHLCILKGKGVNDKFISNYVCVYRLDKKKVFHSLFDLFKLVAAIKPDIVFSSMFHVNIIAIASAYLKYNKEVELFIRESTIPSYRFGLIKSGFIYSITMKIAYRTDLVTRVITQCEAMKYDLLTHYNIQESKVLVINNPVNHEDLFKKSNEKMECELDDNFINMISIGRLEIVKGYDRMIEIFARLERNRYRLYICGEGSQRTNIESMINKYGLQNEIFLMGYLSNPYTILSRVQLFMLTSRSDSFPNAALESLALGVPVIAYNCPGGVSEILNSPDYGVLINDGDIDNYVNSIKKYSPSQYDRQDLIQTSKDRYGINIIESYENIFDNM